MARETITKCDQCGKHVSRTGNSVRVRAINYMDAPFVRIRATGPVIRDFEEADFCSPECAGDFLFSIPYVEAADNG